jgi:uncharacterized protein (TIGR02996 family)
MPDDPAFIRTIAANPDDDAPRLVYADYLEETGDPAKMARAEFIRVQVEKARLVPDTPRWTELWHRDTALLDWARVWRAELQVNEKVNYGGFIRGFIDRISCDSQTLLTFRSPIFDSIPVCRLRLHVVNLRTARAVAQLSELSQIGELELSFHGAESPSNLRAFSRRGRWPKLKRFTVAWVPPGEESARTAWGTAYAELQGAFGECLASDPALHDWTPTSRPRRFI